MVIYVNKQCAFMMSYLLFVRVHFIEVLQNIEISLPADIRRESYYSLSIIDQWRKYCGISSTNTIAFYAVPYFQFSLAVKFYDSPYIAVYFDPASHFQSLLFCCISLIEHTDKTNVMVLTYAYKV